MSAAESRDEKLSCEAYFWAPSSCVPPSPPFLSLHPLPVSPPFVCVQIPVLSLPQSSVPISAMCCSSLPLCLFLAHGIALSLSHSVSMQRPPHHHLLSQISLPLSPPSSGKCAWIATPIAASLMLARTPPTVLPCLSLADVAQEEGIRVLAVLSSLTSFVPVWRLGSGSLTRTLPVSHHAAPLPGGGPHLWLCSTPSPIYLLPLSILLYRR